MRQSSFSWRSFYVVIEKIAEVETVFLNARQARIN